ncbi:MAG TPA: hypothetical protein VH274_06030 [Mycobacteriales bacterium]|jgi:hypothetical protein|nr:hypothetical protein [Mycobacteriales bacterium]
MRVHPGHEDYVRPPLVAVEPRSDRAAAWRFRLVFGLVLLGIVVGVFFLYRALTGSTGEGNPGFRQGAATPPLTVVRLVVR